MAVVVKTLRETIEQLNTILSRDRLVQFMHVRKFILSVLTFMTIEISLYAAFQTPEDDLFYLDEDSYEWRLIRENLQVNEVEDHGKYIKQLRSTMN